MFWTFLIIHNVTEKREHFIIKFNLEVWFNKDSSAESYLSDIKYHSPLIFWVSSIFTVILFSLSCGYNRNVRVQQIFVYCLQKFKANTTQLKRWNFPRLTLGKQAWLWKSTPSSPTQASCLKQRFCSGKIG